MRKAVRLLLVIIMFSGFVAHMWQQFEKYVDGVKTVAVSFNRTDKLAFPTFAFCDSRGYVGRRAFPGVREDYVRSAQDVTDDVDFFGVGKTDYDITKVNQTFYVRVIPTVFNGFCKVAKNRSDLVVLLIKLTWAYFSCLPSPRPTTRGRSSTSRCPRTAPTTCSFWTQAPSSL